MPENKILLADFVQDGRFELHSYLTHLFKQFPRFHQPHLNLRKTSNGKIIRMKRR